MKKDPKNFADADSNSHNDEDAAKLEQLDCLQKEVCNLIRLCREAGIEPDKDWDLPAAEQKKGQLLGTLFLMMQDGQLDEKHFRQVEQWLLQHREMLEFYIDFQMISSLLVNYFKNCTDAQRMERVKDIIDSSQSAGRQ